MSVEEAIKALEQRNKKKVDPAVAKARQDLERRNMPTSGFNSMPGNRIASIGEITRPARQAVTGVGKSFAGVGSWALRNTIDPLLRKTGLNIQGTLSTEDVRAKGGFETAGKIVGDILFGSVATTSALGALGTLGSNLGSALKIAPKGMQALGYAGRIGAAGATEYGISRMQGYTDKESKISATIASAIPALSPVLRGVASEWTTKGAIKKAQSAYDEIFTGTKRGAKALAKSTKAGKQTSKFLAENGFLVKVERGGRINADDTIKQIVDRAEQFEDIYQRTLEETDRFLPTSKYHNLDDYARALKKRMTTPTNKGTGDIERIYDEIDRLTGTFKRTFGENVNNSTMNLIKRGQWRATNVFDATKPAYVSDINYNAGKVAKDFLEKNIDDVDIKAMNGFLGDHWDAVKMLKTVNYSKVKGGRLGNYFARTIGAVAGAKGGPVGALVGAEVGDKVSTIMQANTLGSPLQRYLLKQISPADAEFAKAQEALSALVGKNIERVASQKALPAGKTIFAGPKTPPQGAKTQTLTPDKGVFRDPATGKFRTFFKGTGKAMVDALNETTPGLSVKNVSPKALGGRTATTDLLQEAKKYKSAEEFVKAQFSKKPEYGMAHRPSWEGMPPAHNLLDGDTLPRDVYTHPDYSISSGAIRRGEKAANESWEVLQKIRNNPDAEVTLYRAGAKNELNTGDWVTFSKEYAKQSVEGTEKVHSFKAKAKDVIFAGDDINEFGYYPKSQLTDIWKKANSALNEVTPGLSTKTPVYKGEKDLTTKILKDLEGKSTVSKQYILDATNRGELKQVERDLIRNMLADEPATINVSDFAKKVKAELLPLKIKTSSTRSKDMYSKYEQPPKYENISLPDELRGKVKDYKENVYESPIQTSAGQVHFSGEKNPNYFGHTRIEDMADNKTRRVIEVQSDLYQKGNLERETQRVSQQANGKWGVFDNKTSDPIGKQFNTQAEAQAFANKPIAKLQQYNDPTAHFRMIREEIKKASQDGKTKLQFPTGETAMKIEGLGSTHQWELGQWGGRGRMTPDQIKVGEEAYFGGNNYIITDVLGDGKFKAVPKRMYDDAFEEGGGGMDRVVDANRNQTLRNFEETFDISGKVDTNNPIYKFYEKDMQKYLSKFGGKRVTDDKGVSWIEVPIKKEYAKMPIEAFALAALKVGGTGATALTVKASLGKGDQQKQARK